MAKAGDHVTVVLATLNGEAHLAEQLHSIAAQSHANWSLFVSDDGSTDATRAILADFAHTYPVVVTDGPGKGAAANFLSALCHPDLPPGIVALADQDDVWLEGKLARALRRLGDQPGPAIYAAESILTDAKLAPQYRSDSGKAKPGFGNALGQNLFGGHTTVLNAEALALVRQAGPPDGIAFHDWWLYQLVAGAGGRLVLDATPTALYRQHDGNSLGGSVGAGAGARRLSMVLSGQWKAAMKAHAQALNRVRHMLHPSARQALDDFLAAPSAGPGRVQALRKAGVRRSSGAGTTLMLGAAFLGLI